ncbi:hypothetical protein N0V93_003881 [Gnomoniopsis smithogilvyi]|uniref:Uncharacterized protein n=1 Tax=Gnomoniopsis smithogilvyi TaxID=1191159 RepID=A0A9W9D0A0_9PEZI|nr:hypothetical protein N0V93_003881 [Gnomoniopsis smithogilvyi]
MESAKYHRLEELPEPDYFEIELEKIYGPPSTRLTRVKQWVRRNSLLVAFLALFLLAAILYISAKTAIKPMLTGILRPDSNQLKQAALMDGSQSQAGLSSASSTNTDGEDVILDVAGSDVKGANGDDIVLNETGNNQTNVMISPEDAKDSGDSKNPIQVHQDPEQDNYKSLGNEPTPSQVIAQTTAALQQPTQQPATPPSDTPVVQQDNGQVSIQDATPEEKEPLVPIRATFYSGSEGPKSCRGHPIALIDMPKPQGPSVPTAKQCYNFPGLQSSGCAVFMANKIDGCQASVFAETNCRTYMNTMAFMPEMRPVGGHWRSVSVQCGIPEPDPASLGKPPMFDQMTSIVDNDKAKGG